MAGNTRIRLIDVAAAAGVSKQTISRVVNRAPDVSEATRAHVEEVIARLGYRPSVSARTLCHGRSFTLAVIGADRGFLATDIYQGAALQAQALGYSLLLKTLASPDAQSVEQLLLSLTDLNIDGVLWAIPDAAGRNEWIGQGLERKLAIPMVFLSTEPRPGISTVSFDNFNGARLATEHLLAQGRRRIAHLAGPQDWWVARERIRGWRTALEAAGITPQSTWLGSGDWSAHSGALGMAALLDAVPNLDAVSVANDRMALGAMLTAHRRGLRIPQDLAVIGFDNLPESACFYPPLTTILQDKRRHGETAIARLIMEITSRRGETLALAIPELPAHELIVRESSCLLTP